MMMFLNFLLALLPIIWLIVAMMVFKMTTWKAALGSALVAAAEALLIWKTPANVVMLSALEGICMALWPIVLVIIAAVYTYNLVCRTGGMDVIKQMLCSVSTDKRVLVLLVAWCFGGFMEGMAGFGTAIAIPAGMLTAMGFKPLFSCLLCLVANSVPTAWGSIGIPTITASNLVGFDNAIGLSVMETIQAVPFMIAIPIILVMITGKGIKGMKGMWTITLASGISFVIPMFIVSFFLGAELVMVVASVCSLIVTALLAKRVKPDPAYAMETKKTTTTLKEAAVAAAPFLLIFVFLLGTSKLIRPVYDFLAQFSTTVYFVNETSGTTFSWINTPGVWIFLCAILGGLIQKASFQDFKKVFLATLKQMSGSVYVMLSVLACAKIMIYSGMISDSSAFAIAVTGSFYPFFAPWLGALGTFVTGSGTSSGVLFGQVQMEAAEALHMDPHWMVALNMIGVGAGKMISPQSLAIALSAVDRPGEDSSLMKKAMPYAAVFLLVMSVIGLVGAWIIHS